MDQSQIVSMSNDELLLATRELARRSCEVEADLLLHLGEIDERHLYLGHACPSMYEFCIRELGFSEGAAYNRIFVARAARRFPALIDALRSGRVHLSGLRLLAPHLTKENQDDLLARAAGRTKREIAEILVAMAPWVSPSISAWRTGLPAIVPIADECWRVQFCASREFRDEILEAQDLMRHRVPDGDLAKVFRAAVQLLTTQLKKERFAVGREPKQSAAATASSGSRHIPDAIKRAVHQRDGGQCAFVDDRGKRCEERGFLEYDHEDGFARTGKHDVDAIRLLCRAHNQYVAEQMYGRAFMDAARAGNLSQDKPSPAAEASPPVSPAPEVSPPPSRDPPA